MTTIKKRFMVSTAHRLVDGYVGKCNSLHGHNFFIDVELGSRELDKYGFVIDFGELKSLGKFIDDTFDHGTWLNENDPMVQAISQFPENKVFTLSGNPTVENMARFIFGKMVEMYPDFVVVSVTCEETPNNSACFF